MSDFIDGVNKYFLMFNSGKSMHCQSYKTKYDLALEAIYSHVSPMPMKDQIIILNEFISSVEEIKRELVEEHE